jgi:hypothetical protein
MSRVTSSNQLAVVLVSKNEQLFVACLECGALAMTVQLSLVVGNSYRCSMKSILISAHFDVD